MGMKVRKFLGGVAAASIGFAIGNIDLVSVVNAQDAPRGWFKVCSKQEANEICNTQFQAVASTGQVTTSVNLIEVKGEVERRIFQVTVPSGRLIPPGIKLRIDDKMETTIPYVYCFPQSCMAEVKLDDKLITTLKSGGKLEVVSLNFQNKENPIAITLEGFTAAYDGAPLKRDELQSRQRELQDELRKKAEETRKKLQEAQDKAKSN